MKNIFYKKPKDFLAFQQEKNDPNIKFETWQFQQVKNHKLNK